MSSATTDATTAAHLPDAHASGGSYLTAQKGILSWLFTLDHKRIGVMYLVTVLTFFMVAGLLALAVRVELFTPEGDLLSPELYNKFFTLHGAIMVFLVIIPSVPASLGNFVLPLMLGAKDVAFPRLNLLSYHLYVIGALFMLYAIVAGGLDTGWTFYTPYSIESATAVTIAVFGAFIAGFSSILTGLNFMTTIHKLRAPGMTWHRMPLLAWALYATGVIQILATPVLAITLVLLMIERGLDIGIFDAAMGGDPVLFQHFFWFYSHPAVYIMIVPAMGVMSELVTVHAQKRIFGYKGIAYSSIAIAVISFLVWGHHMFVSGQSAVAGAIFSAMTFFVAVPTAIKVFSWVATLYKGSIQLNTSMFYAMAFLFTFAIGGLTGLFLGTLSTDVHLHDTYFVVAHFHYTMMGGALIAFLGGIHHWWPKITGRMFNEKLGLLGASLVFIGFNATFIPLFVVGSQGMPRRYHTYDLVAADKLDLFRTLHQIATVGAFILGVGLFLTLFYLLHSLKWGKRAPANPWNGKSLEWATASPPIQHNFEKDPVCEDGPYEFDVIDRSAEAAR